MKKTFIIAEIGINHNGDIDLAKKMIDAAKDTGADAVKFQTFIVEEGHSTFYKSKDELEKEKKAELTFEGFLEIKNYCNKKDIIFFSTPFDVKSVDWLEQLEVLFYKIASPEIVNIPLLNSIVRCYKPVIISTGMANVEEITTAVNLFKKKYENATIKQDKNLIDTYKCFKTNIILLHCVSEYPAEYKNINLKYMQTLKSKFSCEVGFSDHTLGIETAIAAAALGASVIEKHFTIDKELPGEDNSMSTEPDEFKRMVKAVRNVELALGSRKKIITETEKQLAKQSRKSIVAAKNLKKGHILKERDLKVKRPGDGISPLYINSLLNKELVRNKKKDEKIFIKDFKEE